MSKVGQSALQGAREALEHIKGNQKSVQHHIKIPQEVDVRTIRRHLHMTRQEFAKTYGFSIRTLEKWERGERHPEASARAYLTIIDKNPDWVKKALSS